MTIVGQTSGTTVGTLTGPASTTATIKVTGGDLYIRKLSVTGGSPGIWATGGNVLRLDHSTVSNNTAGGILLDGAGFDIKNTTVNGNGANIAGLPFGGILIQNPPSGASAPKSITLSTITANQQIGVDCASGTAALLNPVPTSALVSSNNGGDIAGTCGFTSCGTASTTCGAQP
jgi:parallel beta-helix repeat protein